MQEEHWTRKSGIRWQKNLSGTDFHASPVGVRRMDAPNNLTVRQFNYVKFEAVDSTTFKNRI